MHKINNNIKTKIEYCIINIISKFVDLQTKIMDLLIDIPTYQLMF